MGFFDDYPEFYNSGVHSYPNRLNGRYQALIENNKQIISGKRILDIASDNGRWSFAAIKNNAAHVLGVEIKPKSIKFANELMEMYNVPKEKYEFILGDVHNLIIEIGPNTIDTVFCFGFFYHIMSHMDFLSKIKNLNPKYVIFDTFVSRIESSVIEIMQKPKKNKIEGYPTRSALEMMLQEFGFTNIQYYPWLTKNLENWDYLADYKNGKRITLIAEQEDSYT